MASLSKSRMMRLWLLVSAFLVFSMIAIGGLTRLTRSGLSIVEWKPISGVVPPLNEEQWHKEFEKYKQYPEYQKVNEGMALEEFKYIFYWEYFHRLLGRVIGFVFAIPLFFFLWKRQITGKLAGKLGLALLLGGAQGALGWYMVKSGLVDLPRVSAYRLAAHLTLAMFLMCFLFWIAQDLRGRFIVRRRLGALPQATWAFLGLVALQIFYGALTAGLRAGHMYNTFPSMNGLWIPPGLGQLGSVRDIFENPVTVQFIHRCLGWTVLFATIALVWVAERNRQLGPRQRLSIRLVGGMVLAQFVLGVLTIIHAVPVALGSAHQIGASILLLLTVNLVYQFRQKWSPKQALVKPRRVARQ